MKKAKKKKPLYSWDSSSFLAWLNEEAEYVERIELVAVEICSREANLLVSSLIEFEISAARHTPDQIRRVKAFLRRSNVQRIDPNPIIMDIAGRIRDALISENKTLKRADGIILATAVLHGATVLHSTDHHHLRLSRHPAINGLLITKPGPLSGQNPLFPSLD